MAAHPLHTEDTGTQGEGNVELENGFSWETTEGGRLFAYQPQVSYGLSTEIDAIVQPSWVSAVAPGGGAARGLGDTNLDLKWRFYGAAPLSLAVRAGAEPATNQHALGLPHGTTSWHALLAGTVDVAPFTFDADIGLTRNPAGSGRRNLGNVSAATLWALNERWILTVDADAATNPIPGRRGWPATLLGGVIYTARPGLDLDAGYQSSVFSGPRARQFLLGLTYRFSL